MTDDVLRKYTPAECAARRGQFIDATIAPLVARTFRAFPQLRSAVLFVGQFWDDEALDAVHGELRYSIAESPDVASFLSETIRLHNRLYGSPEDTISSDSIVQAVGEREKLEVEAFAYHGLIEGEPAEQRIGGAWDWDRRFDFQEEYCSPEWDSNGEAIPLLAAFCPEGGNQDLSIGESYAPFCILRRARTDAEPMQIDMIGEKLRPWLDGIMPLWERT